jgi:rhodanese-related sulfurtransferase
MTLAERITNLSLEQRLASGALVLGLLALFASPYRGNVVRIDVKELATIVGHEGDHVTAEELAGWIVEGRADYRLVDLRGEREYGEYQIPTAENVTLAALPDASLLENERVVLYSEGGIHAAQAWMLMRAMGFRNVYTLKGGLDLWKEEVLFPTLAENAPAPERARFERSASLARFFGGSPQTGGPHAAAVKALVMPKVDAPTATPGAGPPKPRKKKEGC